MTTGKGDSRRVWIDQREPFTNGALIEKLEEPDTPFKRFALWKIKAGQHAGELVLWDYAEACGVPLRGLVNLSSARELCVWMNKFAGRDNDSREALARFKAELADSIQAMAFPGQMIAILEDKNLPRELKEICEERFGYLRYYGAAVSDFLRAVDKLAPAGLRAWSKDQIRWFKEFVGGRISPRTLHALEPLLEVGRWPGAIDNAIEANGVPMPFTGEGVASLKAQCEAMRKERDQALIAADQARAERDTLRTQYEADAEKLAGELFDEGVEAESGPLLTADLNDPGQLELDAMAKAAKEVSSAAQNAGEDKDELERLRKELIAARERAETLLRVHSAFVAGAKSMIPKNSKDRQAFEQDIDGLNDHLLKKAGVAAPQIHSGDGVEDSEIPRLKAELTATREKLLDCEAAHKAFVAEAANTLGLPEAERGDIAKVALHLRDIRARCRKDGIAQLRDGVRQKLRESRDELARSLITLAGTVTAPDGLNDREKHLTNAGFQHGVSTARGLIFHVHEQFDAWLRKANEGLLFGAKVSDMLTASLANFFDKGEGPFESEFEKAARAAAQADDAARQAKQAQEGGNGG